MISRGLWWLLGTLRKVWVRIVSSTVLAVLTAGLAQVLGLLLSDDLPRRIGADAVVDILSILTSSMLAVTIFSLPAAVATFAAAASTATPRATALLEEDPTIQKVLVTFLGRFMFGLFGLIVLNAQLYAGYGRVVLHVTTVAVVLLVPGVIEGVTLTDDPAHRDTTQSRAA